MKKTLVLVVDRDDDFGIKGGVDTPVIGVEQCSVAAMRLGIADPEDSDVNALYAAINIYREIIAEAGGDVEVALICGNEKVGYRSDTAIVDELEAVLEEVGPDRIILVGDGAEDEYVYPIISSRIKIDSVRKVYVKQAPGIEGTVYIISRILEDPAKRKRFLAPLGWIIALVSLVYIVPAAVSGSSVFSVTGPLIAFLIGAIFLLYAYSVPDWLSKWREKWVRRIRHGSVTVTFFMISSLFIVLGMIIGYLSLGEVYSGSVFQGAAWFMSNAMWPFIFAVLVYEVGGLADAYLSTRTVKLKYVVLSVIVVAMGLVLTGMLDVLLGYYGIGASNTLLMTAEIIAGISLALAIAIVQRRTGRSGAAAAEASEG
ncbi:MAG: DUF373 family protein [Candidatus Methanoplasma sp.]|jgi:putative membrane protein|nr:DUF373 family protein [Candidatus Methanoplasma sp.]